MCVLALEETTKKPITETRTHRNCVRRNTRALLTEAWYSRYLCCILYYRYIYNGVSSTVETLFTNIFFHPIERKTNQQFVFWKKKKNPHTLKLLHHFRFHSLIYQQNASIFKPDAFVQCQSFICLLIYITHTNRKKETKRLTLISRFERAVVVFFVGVLLLFTFI